MTKQEDPAAVSAALIDWVNSFNLPGEPNGISSLTELYDGTVISLILSDIDSKYFADCVVKRSSSGVSLNWVQHFNRLKKILRHITDYYTDVLHTKPPTLPTDELPNLSGIAKEKSAPDIIKLLRLVLALAVKSKKNEAYVQTIQTFPQERQSTLMYLLQQVLSEPSPGFSDNGFFNDDAQLRFEEEIARISAEKDTIEKAHLTLMDEHNELKAKADKLQKAVEEAEARAREAEEAARSLGNKADSYLRSELDRIQNELQDVEAKSSAKDALLESRSTSIANLTRQLDDMRPQAEQARRFEDDLKEAHEELQQTHKKVQRLENIIEKYKLKAEEGNVLLRQNESLEDENSQLKEALRRNDVSLSPLRGKSDALRIETIERAWMEERTGLQREAEHLRQRLKAADEQAKKYQEAIASLEEKGTNSRTPELEGEGLSDEINTSRKDLRLQIARLENELATAKAEAEFNKAAIANGDDNLRERFVNYETELSAANRKIAELTALTLSTSATASADLQKRMDQLLQQLSQLEDDKRNLSKEKDDVQAQLLQQKDRVLEVERETAALKSKLAGIEGEAGGHVRGESVQLQKSLREVTSESKLKDAEIQKLKDLLRKQDQKLKEGKAKLAKATAGADQAIRDENAELTKKLNAQKKSHREEIAFKDKELLMMASAFHDLGSRTQLNSFVVNKQVQGPMSFLAQQRNSISSLSKKE